jgi:AraC family transcriptional regulator, dual regulator of chb operon
MNTIKWHEIAPNGESFHVTRLYLKNNDSFGIHTHDFAELFLVTIGTANHTIDGRHEALDVGHLIFLCPETRHGFKSTAQEGFEYYNVAYPLSTLQYLIGRYLPENDPFRQVFGNYRITLDAEKAKNIAGQIRSLSLAERSSFEIDRFLLNLFHEIHFGTPGTTPSFYEWPDWLRYAYERIQKLQHCHKGTEEFIYLANRSPEHVARETKRWTGKTPTNIVNEARLMHVVQMLTMSDDNASTIALNCGFCSISHFYSLFQRYYSTSPHRYRILHRKII